MLVVPCPPDPRQRFPYRYVCHTTTTLKLSNLLLVNRTVQTEAQAVLYRKFRFYFCVLEEPLYILYFSRPLRQSLRNQLSHLALVIRVFFELCMTDDDLYNGKYYYIRNLWEGRESNEMLALAFPNLKSVVFELQIPMENNPRKLAPLPDPLPAAPTAYYARLLEKCTAVARPFHNYRAHSPGLAIRCVAEPQTVGGLIAALCEERDVNEGSVWEEWPWTETDEHFRRYSRNAIKRNPPFATHFPEITAMRKRMRDPNRRGCERQA